MIHIVWVDISEADGQTCERLYRQASPARKQRADRCRRQADRLRCVVSDALLRAVLGPAADTIEASEQGKPFLPGRDDFCFNLSHSGDLVVLAWGDSPVGVDVQKQNTAADPLALAQRWFTPDELACVREGPLVRRFYEIWTGKESYLKFTGQGLRRDLRSFSVLDPEPGVVYRHLHIAEGYSLCLCSTDREYTLEQWQLGKL